MECGTNNLPSCRLMASSAEGYRMSIVVHDLRRNWLGQEKCTKCGLSKEAIIEGQRGYFYGFEMGKEDKSEKQIRKISGKMKDFDLKNYPKGVRWL